MQNQTLKKLFNKKKSMAHEFHKLGNELDCEIVKQYGFHYSETNDDQIIDTLDYGISGISFEEFDEKMKDYYKQQTK